MAVEDIVTFPELRDVLARIKGFGYMQLVLMGHSAGGLVGWPVWSTHMSHRPRWRYGSHAQ